MTDAELYPEHEKLRLVKDTSQAIYDFIDWLEYEHQIKLCQWLDGVGPGGGSWLLMPQPLVNLLAQYFGIDQNILEVEKRAILDALHASQASAQAGPGPGATIGSTTGPDEPGSLVTAGD